MRKFTIYNLQFTNRRGVASLGAMLLLGSVIVEVGLIGLLLVTLLTSTNLGVRLSAEALGAAHAGIQEGMLAILRSKDGPYGNPVLTVGNANATVAICLNSDFDLVSGPVSNPATCPVPGGAPGTYVIHSLGDAFGRQRWVVAIVEVDPGTGLLKVQSIEEKTR